jgi:Protein of unknown function (DUF1153)
VNSECGLMVQTPLATALPSPKTRRWVARRKAAVVAAVCCGQITLEDACRLYHLSGEEFISWQRAFEKHGVNGLRATSLQRYRGGDPAQPARTAPPAATAANQVSAILNEERLDGLPCSEFSQKQ